MAKKEEIIKKVEGFIDSDRRVFVVTKDEFRLLSEGKERSVEEQEVEREKIKSLFKKYKPEWMK